MLRPRRRWLITIVTAVLVGCSRVEIRTANDSDVDFDQVVVDNVSYGAVSSGQASAYHPFSQAYSYAAVSVTVDGKVSQIMPKDYVGERPLSPGRYTYHLTYEVSDKGTGVLGLSCREDD